MEEQRLSIYEKNYVDGPVTKKHKIIAWTVYFIFALAGIAPTIFNLGLQLKIAGMGIVLPGGGFLAIGGIWGILFFILTLILFIVGVVLWNTIGNQLAPFFVWIAADILAFTLFLREPVWGHAGTCAAIVIPLVYFIRSLLIKGPRLKKLLKRQKERLEFFKTEIPAEEALAAPEVADDQFELTEMQLAQQRHLFNLAFGPYGEFKGFTDPSSSQMPLNALRYQLSQMLNTLQQIQCQYTPNFHGYAAEAQRKLIEMYLHPRVWRYWRIENFWGNLKFGADPIGKENVMLTGFFLINVTMYMRNTGDMRYAEEGGLTFRDKKLCFPHSAHTLADSIVYNWDTFDYIVYPCEPNWNYSLCNWKAIQSMVNYDALFNTERWAKNRTRVYNAFVREMALPDGGSYLFKTTRTGFGFYFPSSEAFQIPM